jgi:hypothetical protein
VSRNKNFQHVLEVSTPGASTLYTNAEQLLSSRYLQAAMVRYFREHALRAPSMPPGEFVNGRQAILFRGMHGSEYFDVGKALRDGQISERGFIAMTRNLSVAREFAEKHQQLPGIIVQIDGIKDVPRGTPWLWFDKKTLSANHKLKSFLPGEQEVLLPPGRLIFKSDPWKMNSEHVTWRVAAKYVPDPAFLEKNPRYQIEW